MDEKLRILLCEDDENLGMLLREYLQAKGIRNRIMSGWRCRLQSIHQRKI